jgi:hypothetical protein
VRAPEADAGHVEGAAVGFGVEVLSAQAGPAVLGGEGVRVGGVVD